MKTLNQLLAMKQDNDKISMVTAYDYPSAKQAEAAQIDTILVGDSLGMTVLGYESTVQVTVADMIHHTKAVRRGAPDTFVIVDVPFGAVGVSEAQDIQSAIKLYRETDANAIKAEGAHLTTFIKIVAILEFQLFLIWDLRRRVSVLWDIRCKQIPRKQHNNSLMIH